MNKEILIGKITAPHGIKGAVKIISFAEKPIDIFKYNVFDKNNNIINIKRIGTLNNGMFISQIDNIKDRNEAEKLRNVELFINRSDLEELKENEFYIDDLIGMIVKSDKEDGLIKNVYNYGAGDVLEIEWKNKKNEDIPFNNNYIKSIDIENKIIYINKPEYI